MKKCLVLDLDNTLWGGVVGEDGVDGIHLGLDSPGNSFIAFQQAILDVHNKGVILAINSRNNEDDAFSVIRKHPNMILKECHFAAFRINWKDKAENIKELAQELNIGIDSMVFLDDDETNRELVRALHPEVAVPDLPDDPKEYTKFFNNLTYFDTTVVTDEDQMRGNLYVTERLRKQVEKTCDNKEDFLSSLSLELFIGKDDNRCLARLAQLTEKTNQFNVAKYPLSEDEIATMIASGSHSIYYGRLHDMFGDYGIIIFAVIEKKETIWHITSLLMSCRVFGRDVEEAFFAELLREARLVGVTAITIAYEATPKNVPAKTFIDKHFVDYSCKVPLLIDGPKWITTYPNENI